MLACVLCGHNGCNQSIELSCQDIKLIVYVCDSCSTEGCEKRAEELIQAQIIARINSGKMPRRDYEKPHL